MSKNATAPSAEAGAAAPAATTATTTAAPKGDPLHQPTPPRPRDEFTGLGGTYTRDPETGKRTPVKPTAPAAGDDTATA